MPTSHSKDADMAIFARMAEHIAGPEIALVIGKGLDRVVFVGLRVVYGSKVRWWEVISPLQLTAVVLWIPGLGHVIRLATNADGDPPAPDWRLTVYLSSRLRDLMRHTLKKHPKKWRLAELSNFDSRRIVVWDSLVPVALALKGRGVVRTFQSFPTSDFVTLWTSTVTEALVVQYGWSTFMKDLVVSFVIVWGDTPALRIETPEGDVPNDSELFSADLHEALMPLICKCLDDTASIEG